MASSSERRKIQRRIARELRAGNYRPRAAKLTVKARQLASYRTLVDRNINGLGLNWDEDEAQKFTDAADAAYNERGLQWLQTRLNIQYADIRAYVEDGNKDPGNAHWGTRDDRINEMLWYYHGAIYAFL